MSRRCSVRGAGRAKSSPEGLALTGSLTRRATPCHAAAKAIDQYVELRGKPAAEAVEPDARLVAIVERMFERCVFAALACLLLVVVR